MRPWGSCCRLLIAVDTILGSARRDQGEVSKAADWLKGMLADGDWHDSAGLKKLAAAQDISERTLERAAGEVLGVEYERRGFPSSTRTSPRSTGWSRR